MSEVVYFVQAEVSRNIKIGYTRALAARLSTLRTSTADRLHLIGAVLGNEVFEKALHREFRDIRVSREWFRETPELLARIAALVAERGVTEITPRQGPKTGVRDEFTERAAGWLLYLAQRESERRGGGDARSFRGDVAERVGIRPGTIDNIGRSRIIHISTTDYEAIRAAMIEEKQAELGELRALADSVEAAQRVDIDVAAARRVLDDAERLLKRAAVGGSA